jgi:hypothetical protein
MRLSAQILPQTVASTGGKGGGNFSFQRETANNQN